MADKTLRILVRRLRCATAPAGDAALSDAQLLERFVVRRDEAAFELLVWRHGTMVLNLCRRLLRHEQDAEDAFQATFLVLARKARSIGKREACAGWLYKVAYRVALAARVQSAARAARERSCPEELPAAEVTDDLIWRDLRPVLDEEVNRLPENCRAAFVLCCLEGRTGAEAAEQLCCPEGTVLSRLSRARERLRLRLLRRGVSLSVGLLTAAIAANGQAAEITAGLVTETLKAALTFAAGNAVVAVASARATALTEGALRAMLMSKMKMTLGIVVIVGLVGIGAGLIGNALLADTSQPGTPEPHSQFLRPAALVEEPTAAAEKKPEADDATNAAMRRIQSRRKLQQIGIALHNYADTYRKLPAPAIYEGYPSGLLPGAPGGPPPMGGGAASPPSVGGPPPGPGNGFPAVGANAKPLLSWRVAILPFLGEDDLYKHFKRDEPWDSAHNRKLLARMPAVYAAPGMKDGDRTYYQAIVGTGAAWEPRQEMGFPNSFPDGTSHTILVVEAGAAVPWTKPEDLPYVADQALPKFGGLFGGDFHALFADGVQVRFISAKADEQQLRFAIMTADGNPIIYDKLLVTGITGAGGKVDVNDLPRENERLRAAIDALRKEAANEQQAMDLLRAKIAGGSPKLDAKTAKAIAENAELQRAFDRAMEDLEKLQAERQRLVRELEQPQKKVDNKP